MPLDILCNSIQQWHFVELPGVYWTILHPCFIPPTPPPLNTTTTTRWAKNLDWWVGEQDTTAAIIYTATTGPGEPYSNHSFSPWGDVIRLIYKQITCFFSCSQFCQYWRIFPAILDSLGAEEKFTWHFEICLGFFSDNNADQRPHFFWRKLYDDSDKKARLRFSHGA